MKKTELISLILSTVALIVAIVFGVLFFTLKSSPKAESNNEENVEITAQKGDIVYFNLDEVLQRYDMASDKSAVVQTKADNIQKEITRRQKKLENAAKDYQEKMQKGLLTRSVAEQKALDLQKQENEFNQYVQQKQAEMQEEQMVMMNQLGDAIKTFVDNYNEDKQFAMILTNQGGAPVITADGALDITEEIIAGLNEEYIKNRNKKTEE